MILQNLSFLAKTYLKFAESKRFGIRYWEIYIPRSQKIYCRSELICKDCYRNVEHVDHCYFNDTSFMNPSSRPHLSVNQQ